MIVGESFAGGSNDLRKKTSFEMRMVFGGNSLLEERMVYWKKRCWKKTFRHPMGEFLFQKDDVRLNIGR